MKIYLTVLLAFLSTLLGQPAAAIDEPVFDILATKNGIEYRQYEPYVVAETKIPTSVERNKAANIGFRRLFKYISGANRDTTKIAMTAPVRQRQEGSKIEMTAPVRQEQLANSWSIAFVLPATYSLDNAPQPTSLDVELRLIPGEIVAVLTYSGRWSASNVRKRTGQLLDLLAQQDVETTGEVTVAYYNSPFSLPFMRRNEIIAAVANVPAPD